MNLAELRAAIPATHEVVYFNTGWAGPSPQPVLDRMREVFERQAAAGPASIEGMHLAHEVTEAARQAAAELLQVARDEVMLTHGTTEGVHVVLHGYPWQPGDELVTCTLEHPALGTPPGVLEERHGVVARRVEIPANASPDDQLERIAAVLGPKTRVVALSHIQFSCGLRMPIPAIADLAHRAGALLLVDGAQTGGQIPLDVRALGADFYAISGQKWVLGPQGTGALFVARERVRDINPLFNTHALVDARPPLIEGAVPDPLFRFRVTSHSPALLAGFGAALRLLLDVGLDTIEERVHELSGRLRAGLAAMPGCTLTGPTEPGTTCGLVSVALDRWEPARAVEALWERWRIAARAVVAPPAIRFSTHAFNTEAEIDQAVDALRSLLAEGPP